jgi:hypothetical protein
MTLPMLARIPLSPALPSAPWVLREGRKKLIPLPSGEKLGEERSERQDNFVREAGGL